MVFVTVFVGVGIVIWSVAETSTSLSPQAPEFALYSGYTEQIPVKSMIRDVGVGATDHWVYVGYDTNVFVLSAFGPAHRNIGGTNFVLAAKFYGGTNNIWLAIRK